MSSQPNNAKVPHTTLLEKIKGMLHISKDKKTPLPPDANGKDAKPAPVKPVEPPKATADAKNKDAKPAPVTPVEPPKATADTKGKEVKATEPAPVKPVEPPKATADTKGKEVKATESAKEPPKESKLQKPPEETKAPKKEKKVRPLLLEFRCRGEQFFSAHSAKITFPFTIGHAADNSLVIPAQDRTSADYEAVIENVKGSLELKAAPNRYFYVHGVRKTSYTLPTEDRVAIGDCELFVSPAMKLKATPCDVHRLECLNGPQKGQIIRLEKPSFVIGSNAECDFRIQDDVVSGIHTELKIMPAGDVWVKDAQSLNGSFVNGRRLAAQERILMDSDKVSVACYDFRFLDKNVLHTRSNLLRNLLVMGTTLIVVFIAFLCFSTFIPHATKIATSVEKLMREEKFKEAEELLKEMPKSQHFEENVVVYSQLQNRLDLYKTTYNAWVSFQKCVARGNLVAATKYTGQLDLSREDAWNWNATNVHERMEFARKCMHGLLCYRELYQLLYSTAITDPNQLQVAYSNYKKDPMLKRGEKEPEWTKPLYKKIDYYLDVLHQKCEQLNRIYAQLDAMADGKESIEKTISMLAEERKKAGCLRYFIWKAQDVLDQMDKAQKTIDQNIEYFTKYEFDNVVAESPFPSAESCQFHPALLKKRNQMFELRSNMLNAGVIIKEAFYKNVMSLLTQEQLNFFMSLENYVSTKCVEDFDHFKHPLPQVLAEEKNNPSCKITMHILFNLIQQTLTLDRTGYDLTLLEGEAKSMPMFKTSKQLADLIAIVSRPEGHHLLKNQFGKDMAIAKKIMVLLDNVVAHCNETAEKHYGTRLYLMLKPLVFVNNPDLITSTEINRYKECWKQYRQKLQALVDQYDPLGNQDLKKVRQQIFEVAIPGDPLVNPIWNDVE